LPQVFFYPLTINTLENVHITSSTSQNSVRLCINDEDRAWFMLEQGDFSRFSIVDIRIHRAASNKIFDIEIFFKNGFFSKNCAIAAMFYEQEQFLIIG
jgi:hypothetical protein